MSGKRENRKTNAGGPANWWRQHRTWVAGLNRGQKVRYRIFQILVVVAILAIAPESKAAFQLSMACSSGAKSTMPW